MKHLAAVFFIGGAALTVWAATRQQTSRRSLLGPYQSRLDPLDRWKIEELLDNGATIDERGLVTLYHRTTKENAERIRRTGLMYGKEDGLFFSTAPGGQAIGYGPEVVEFKIPISKIELDDVFGNEAHVRMPVKRNQKVNISSFLAGVLQGRRESAIAMPRAWWRKSAPPKDKLCYRTKTDALNVFREYNQSVIDEFGGESAKHRPSEFDAINARYGLKGKQKADTVAKALWLSMPPEAPYCLDEIDIHTLNETAPAKEHPVGFQLPDYAVELIMAQREQERWAQYDDENEVPF